MGETTGTTRRRFLSAAGRAVAAGSLGPAVFTRPARGGAATLRIAQWTHFVPAFDEWFDRKFAQAWGEKHGVTVVVDHFSASDLRARAATEVATQQGHDLFGFSDSPAGYEEHVLPVDDVVSECERRFGKLAALGRRGTLNPKSKRYFALADSWAPALLHYRTDLWAETGMRPDTWEAIREGSRRIKEKHAAIAGFGLAPEPDSNAVLRGLIWAYGGAEQDEAGQVTINSRGTVEAVKLMAAIYRESMTPDVFMWDPSSNNRVFVWGRASIIENAISAMRTAEKQNPEVAKKSTLAPPAAGPKDRLSAAHLLHCYVVWRFAQAPELAKTFLVDLVAAAGEALRASELYNLPTFAKAVPDLPRRLAADKQARGRYALLADAERWSALPGYPGHVTPAIEEVVHRFVIPSMFARAARGEQTAEESVRLAELEMKRIFARWTK